MIRTKNLFFQYTQGTFSLEVPSLIIDSSRQIALVGPSGSGKSTLLNLLAGILDPHCGSIHIGEHQITGQTESWRRKFRLKNIGMVFQSFALIPYLTVRENVVLPLRLRNHPIDRDAVSRCRKLLDAVGLNNFEKRYTSQLSQGEQQRVAICRALISHPKVVLADEPTGNLDHNNATNILDIMLEQVKQSDATLIMSTHDRSLFSTFDEVIDICELRRHKHE